MDIPRRTILKAGGAALLAPIAGLFDHGDHERVASVLSGHSRPDMESIEHFDALLAHFRKLDDLHGPRNLHGAVQSTLGAIDGLRDAAEPGVRQALPAVSADLPAEYVRDRAWPRFRSAEAHAYGNDPVQAATVGREAAQLAIDHGSGRTLDEARKLHARLARAHSLPEVRELGELLQTAGDQVRT